MVIERGRLSASPAFTWVLAGAALVWTALVWALLVLSPLAAAQSSPGDRPEASLAGRFLVAEDSMGDPRFAETVIYMVRHDRDGAMGMVVNRPLGELPLRELLRGLGGGRDSQVPGTAVVHYGGPVQPQLGFVIHTADRLYGESHKVGAGIAVTSQPVILQAIGRGDPPRRHLLALGYAGWAPGQLEAEMAREDWFTLPFDEDLLFDGDHDSKWRRAKAMREIEL